MRGECQRRSSHSDCDGAGNNASALPWLLRRALPSSGVSVLSAVGALFSWIAYSLSARLISCSIHLSYSVLCLATLNGVILNPKSDRLITIHGLQRRLIGIIRVRWIQIRVSRELLCDSHYLESQGSLLLLSVMNFKMPVLQCSSGQLILQENKHTITIASNIVIVVKMANFKKIDTFPDEPQS